MELIVMSILVHRANSVNAGDELTPEQAALTLARIGLRVFPVCGIDHDLQPTCRNAKCPSPGKHPLERGWQRSATSDPETIRGIWLQYPHANLGVLTGGGVLVVDVDPRNGGTESFDDLRERYGDLPDTLEVQTGGGGWHYYFQCPRDLTIPNDNRGKLGRCIDVKGQGGFVVGPGSWHASGNQYDFEASTDIERIVIADAPRWLLDFVASKAEPSRRDRRSSETKADRKPSVCDGKGSPERREGFPRSVPAGQRHDFLVRQAAFCRDIGFGADRTYLFLWACREQLCESDRKHPVSDRELQDIMTWTFETAEPRPHRKAWPSQGALKVLTYLDEHGHKAPMGMKRCAAKLTDIQSGTGLSRAGVHKAIRGLELRALIRVETSTGRPNTYLVSGGSTRGLLHRLF